MMIKIIDVDEKNKLTPLTAEISSKLISNEIVWH